MKKFNISSLLVMGGFMLSSLLMISCNEDEVTYDRSNTTAEVLPQSYIQVISGFFPYDPDGGTYPFEFNVINGTNGFTEVRMFKSFTDASTGNTVEDILQATYAPTGYGRTVVEQELTYADLAQGISGLPTDGSLVPPGSGWSFRFEATTSEGEVIDVPGGINIIFSKWAGNYEVIDSKYTRRTSVDEDFGDWNGTVVFIGYVDAVTLSYNDRWGYFSFTGCGFDIEFDETTLEIVKAPIILSCGLFSGNREMSCTSDDTNFDLLNTSLGFIACDNSNYIDEDEVNGNHTIYLTYGYLSDSGPRNFWEVLRKL